MTARLPHLCVAVSVLVGSIGCDNNSGPFRAAVRGCVTLDNVPLEQGSINFFPTGTTRGPATGTQINNGLYELSAAQGPAIGQARVEIVSTKATGRRRPDVRNPGNTLNEMIALVPPRYNRDSTLTAHIRTGNNVVDFHLKSK